MDEWKPLYTVDVIANGSATMGNNRVFFKKLNIKLPHDPTTPLLGIYLKENENRVSKRYAHSHIHCSLIH